MIVSRTPLRISLFGGGTDYPEWFQKHGGSVIGMAIDKHVYVTGMHLSPLHPYKFRLYWRQVERAMTADDIEHPVVRETLKLLKDPQPMGFSIVADLPARNGLGSSSAFTVGFHNTLWALLGSVSSPAIIAEAAIEVERNILGEAGGWQDQILCAYGGINRINFAKDESNDFGELGTYEVIQITMGTAVQRAFVNSLFLVHTGGNSRNSWDVNAEQIERTKAGENDELLRRTMDLVERAEHALMRRQSPEAAIHEIGELLHEGWELKRQFSPRITTPEIDQTYQRAMGNGAIGGKLCGAGGSGFLCVVVPPERRATFLEAMKPRPVMRVRLDTVGSTILHGEAATYG